MDTDKPNPDDEFASAARSGRRGIAAEFLYYVKLYRAWLVVPVILAVAILGGLVMVGGSGAAPFIYALF